MKAGVEGQQSDKEVISKILEELKASKAERTFQTKPSSTLARPVCLSSPRVSGKHLSTFNRASTSSFFLINSSSNDEATKLPTLAVEKPIVPDILVVLEVTSQDFSYSYSSKPANFLQSSCSNNHLSKA
ncbi:hypothetical protein D8674_038197 [Pyrus ussuriensis x Pyrus communis]|uniref:Uncharacterized protein n=1 Tax=Pyrus ussuriensis x Pyrus communis TaxID=2448454 RepID=A0A5N5I6E8_9ROSA|nr:hypothetical protein D8674_038197 [Pyrus ussuriensis x Pyrus communis]